MSNKEKIEIAGFITVEEVGSLLRLKSNDNNKRRAIINFLRRIETTRNVQVLFKIGNIQFSTVNALKAAIPEAFNSTPAIEENKDVVYREQLENLADETIEQFKNVRNQILELKSSIRVLSNKLNKR